MSSVTWQMIEMKQADPEDCPEALMGRLYGALQSLPGACSLRCAPLWDLHMHPALPRVPWLLHALRTGSRAAVCLHPPIYPIRACISDLNHDLPCVPHPLSSSGRLHSFNCAWGATLPLWCHLPPYTSSPHAPLIPALEPSLHDRASLDRSHPPRLFVCMPTQPFTPPFTTLHGPFTSSLDRSLPHIPQV